MGPEKYFCELAVYRLPRERYATELEEDYKKHLKALSYGPREIALVGPSRMLSIQQRHFETYGGCWQFNEAIGFVRLFFLGSQIRGEYFGVKVKRVIRTRRKRFEFLERKLAPEITPERPLSNAGIYRDILQYVDDCRGELKGRVIDTECLDTIGPHVDWVGLLQAK